MQRKRRKPMEQTLQTKFMIIGQKEESKTEGSQENDGGRGDFRGCGRGTGYGRGFARGRGRSKDNNQGNANYASKEGNDNDVVLLARKDGDSTNKNLWFMEEPKETHWKIVIGVETVMTGEALPALHSSLEIRHFLGCQKKKLIVTLSTCEAEYIATSSCVSHAIWLRSLIKEIKFEQNKVTQI
ncbi:hypothetical protein ZIOFF_047398 [Zingiber officinale]|uniref:Uncharacterized protein n=1 Tax=Zingiber officinale TaxID=94328 RepID=A0A8J5FT30_ZINOF|nr:hypothetical protein ZIOFF_047398 [Zingiber officinale]